MGDVLTVSQDAKVVEITSEPHAYAHRYSGRFSSPEAIVCQTTCWPRLNAPSCSRNVRASSAIPRLRIHLSIFIQFDLMRIQFGIFAMNACDEYHNCHHFPSQVCHSQ